MTLPLIAPHRRDTPEFTLRIYQPGDGAALSEATTESYELLRPWMPWASPSQTVEEAEAVCRRLGSGFLAGTDYTLGIWDGDTLLGGTGFHLRCGPIEWKVAEIGMWIRASRSGEGLGSRVLAAMLEWGFRVGLGATRVEVRHEERGKRSGCGKERNGARSHPPIGRGRGRRNPA